ncbi:MAG: hypothetical protein KAR45_22140, partial [Desulfobacteraceae bacterium]|nr:hypothetical protein [Desulfobacteraceae bacterium]
DGVKRKWNNESTSWSTGTAWDTLYNEITFYIVPETYLLLQTIGKSYLQSARDVKLDNNFWEWSLVERRAWFVKETMVNYLPHEILPGDLIAGARFNIQTSLCLNKEETRKWNKLINGKKGVRKKVKWFHDHGYGNTGATSGHLIPGHEKLLSQGWKGIDSELNTMYESLSKNKKNSKKGNQLRAMITASAMAPELSTKYSEVCLKIADAEKDVDRKNELENMAANLKKVPWEPPETFWEAIQALWINHMLVMADENYPGPGVSFGRFDQFLYPYYEKSIADGMERDFAKEILKCFWVHCNTAYDAMIRSGNQGITAGFGQLITLSGMGKDGKDMTNDLTYLILEVIDE